MKKQDIYFIEYTNYISFYWGNGLNNCFKFNLLMNKTKENYNKFQKILKQNKYNFIDLLN